VALRHKHRKKVILYMPIYFRYYQLELPGIEKSHLNGHDIKRHFDDSTVQLVTFYTEYRYLLVILGG
jgi:hypothetical protein